MPQSDRSNARLMHPDPTLSRPSGFSKAGRRSNRLLSGSTSPKQSFVDISSRPEAVSQRNSAKLDSARASTMACAASGHGSAQTTRLHSSALEAGNVRTTRRLASRRRLLFLKVDSTAEAIPPQQWRWPVRAHRPGLSLAWQLPPLLRGRVQTCRCRMGLALKSPGPSVRQGWLWRSGTCQLSELLPRPA